MINRKGFVVGEGSKSVQTAWMLDGGIGIYLRNYPSLIIAGQ